MLIALNHIFIYNVCMYRHVAFWGIMSDFYLLLDFFFFFLPDVPCKFQLFLSLTWDISINLLTLHMISVYRSISMEWFIGLLQKEPPFVFIYATAFLQRVAVYAGLIEPNPITLSLYLNGMLR